MLTRENFKVAADSSGGEAINNNNNTAHTAATMVDNNTMSSSGGDSVTTTPNVDNHNKLILKLPKTTADQQEIATSSSCSSSSSSSSSAVQSDTRKVEPLKINLLQHTNNNNNNDSSNNNNNNSNNNSNNGTPTVPKITIKPIFAKANSDTAISSDCSSSAEEEAVQRDSSVDSSSPSSPNEPHIVPKLTIRSAEEGGTAHSSIVPKLTIKMNEGTTSNLTTTITTTTNANNTSVLPPPLPKLTIKTMLDGSSGAIISSLSPASSSSSSSSNSSGNAQVGGGTNLVPKLTIKTNASGSCVSSTEEQQVLPKLTIKTGQEHAMIITQHSNDASSMLSIPKMTIKTKTLRAEDAELGDLRDDEQVGKIPKLTIKTNEDMAPLSPLVVRNLPQNESPDRVPKLMISRQQDNNLLAVNNHLKSNHCMDESLKVNKKSNNCAMEEQEKVPKLTIKHINVVTEESLETTMNKSIPKLTIKNLSSPKLKMKAVLDEEKLVNSNDMPINNNNNNSINNKSSTDNQRDSDDMDIDEALQAHDPKIFNNVSTMFNDFGKSGVAAGAGLLTSAVRRVIDTVDLTASPERSPAHTTLDSTTVKHATTTPLLLERLQRDTSVIQTTLENSTSNNSNNNNTNTSFLLNQLNAPRALPNLRHTSLPLMANNRLFQPQQQQPQQSPMNKNLKYPNLTERLLANGLHTVNTLVPEATNSLVAPVEIRSKSNENVIDSIEILDTPDGSSQSSLDENASVESVNEQVHQFNNGVYLREETISPNKYANSESPMHFKNDASHAKFVDNYTDLTPNKIRRVDKESGKKTSPPAEKVASPNYKGNNMHMDETLVNTGTTSGHRSRKQKHEHLLTMDEEDPLKLHPMHENVDVSSKKSNNINTEGSGATPIARKRGRPKKNPLATTPTATPKTPINNTDQSCKSRRVQLLRKRLAIDMVAAEQPFETEANEVSKSVEKDRSLRTPVRAARNGISSGLASGKRSGRRSMGSRREDLGNSTLHHFGGSNSSLSSGCSSSSLSSTTITTTTAAQIDLTMSSSSSSANSCSQTTTTLTTVKSKHNTMLPPSKILSSDPVPDVVFKPNDFSSALVTQQFQMHNSGQSSEEIIDAELSSHSEESLSPYKTPTRGRGRGRGSRGTRGSATSGRGSRGGPRMGRGASAVAKAIAMSRPRCVGGLKHTPDPKRLKGLVSPGPQVFEEDTRMSADLTQISLQQQQSTESTQHSETNPVVRQLEFLTNDESQSSVISNTSILDPNTVAAMQNGAASVLKQRPKKKKMEVCVAEDTECNVSSIAEYDWPPPKGCCPSKNRDTFMIQEQVALYLGIKSFKRKYPDLPRRQIDMEERNWLQEKNLVSERMCDLGITAVWASDILDIMYADFYDKYEEYKDYVRQKHLREIEAKQKALGMNILGNGRNLQVRERAMLSASKWNSYCGRARKSERVACLDMQSFIVNVPIPASAPAHTMVHREMAEIIADVAAAENIPEPPTLLPKRVIDMTPKIEKAYPLALIPGQYCENYKRFEPSELYALPLNTALMDVTKLISDKDAESVKDMKYHNREKRQKRRQRVTKEDDSDTESVSSYSSKGSHSSTSSSSSSCSSSDSDCSSSDNEEIIHRCGVCQRTQNSNLKALPETFIKCYSCARRVHPSCIEMPQRMVARVRNYNWQCATCKCCIKCKRSQDTNKMLFCEQCDRGYHIYCLKLKSVPDGRWSCERCCVCMRCGATKPEGLPQLQLSPSGEKVKQVKHKKVKWINEYRIDHITKLREHCSMLCVPCARAKPANKRVHIVTPPVNSKSVKLSNIATPTAVTYTTTSTNVSETNVIKTTNKSNIVKMNNSQSVSNTTTNHVSTVKLQTTTTTTTTATTLPANNIKTTAAIQPTIHRVKQQQIKPATNKSTTTTTTATSSSDVVGGDISLAGGTAIAPPPVVA